MKNQFSIHKILNFHLTLRLFPWTSIALLLMMCNILACPLSNDVAQSKANSIPLCNSNSIAIDLKKLPTPSIRSGIGNSHLLVTTHTQYTLNNNFF